MSKSRLILSLLITTPIHIGIHSLHWRAAQNCDVITQECSLKRKGWYLLFTCWASRGWAYKSLPFLEQASWSLSVFLWIPRWRKPLVGQDSSLCSTKLCRKWLLNESCGCTTDVLLLWLFIKIPDQFLDQEKYVDNLLICKDKKMYLSP